ncbi:hypothetical protein BJ912DRAFT_952186 [Pholiota molesta]|nr:hypothetical protein BJ912DRAFT_952186 [Pholiota molesta]
MSNTSSNQYKAKLRSYTQKKTAAKLSGLRPKAQNRLGDISRVAPPTNVSKQPQKIRFSGSFSDPEDVDMDSSGDSDNVADDDDKMISSPIPIPKKASRAADKAPRKSGGVGRKVTRVPVTPTKAKGGPSRIVHSTPRKPKQPHNPPKVSISSSSGLSTPTRHPRPTGRLNAQIRTKPRNLPIYAGTPSPETKPVPQMRPEVVYAIPFDISGIQARELQKLRNQRKEIHENVRLAQGLLQENPELFAREEAGHSGNRTQRFGSHGTEQCVTPKVRFCLC